ncbi:MAG: hypothetical protein WD270_08465 [Acetobacterales bacterium]
MSKVHILHENAEWVVPLEAALQDLGTPYEIWFLDAQAEAAAGRHGMRELAHFLTQELDRARQREAA